eukprot:4500825-Pyramimonas_sp.AAC.1
MPPGPLGRELRRKGWPRPTREASSFYRKGIGEFTGSTAKLLRPPHSARMALLLSTAISRQ